ncbi:MAG TPA: pyridoxamine 5'-phosphate oxidase family protein [Methylophilus sp.]|uniref:HugZ family pyridoxamine 5'-phosphate oxidase n=1 Tax=Methylophilus sp. TaxID=29541 RepID=UPI002C8C63AF|nr:pyridoxamine 5'-phosphate oxidase family protein [Methylophilus sp.]HSH87004.1 pyridoxamine 5'-phosphate oxidase family protein [Methylophilus sp.]
MTDQEKLQSVGQEAIAFKSLFQTVQLASVNAQGVPEASYAAFVERDNKFYIYVSELATHCANLRETGLCSAMFIESEKDAGHLFARKRLVFKCTAQGVDRNSAKFNEVMALFYEKFGQFMDAIGKLTDFHMMELTPSHGSYVAGFARAYHLNGQDLLQITHRNDQGHAAPDSAAQQKLDELA